MTVRFAMLVVFLVLLAGSAVPVSAQPLEAGTARADITNPEAAAVHDPAYAKALVLRQGETTAVLVTVDAVAIGGIGAIPDSFLGQVRTELARDPGIAAERVIVNASHCHASVRGDCATQVVQVVRDAWKGLEPVTVAVGSARETRISENRRVTLRDGSQVDMRRAYAFAWDDEIASIGPIDPQVGLLRLDRSDGRPLAALYTFACHPIMNPPGKGSSADFTGVASDLIEKGLGHGAMAFFVQGCGGDINPVRYKEPLAPPDAEPLGLRLGSTVLKEMRQLRPAAAPRLVVRRRLLGVPRVADSAQRIAAIEAEQDRLVRSLKGTDINFKSFLPLLMQQKVFPGAPATSKQGYLHDEAIGRDDLTRLDAENRAQVEAYLANIQVMERLTRLNTNLALLKMHQKKAEAAGGKDLEVEVCGLRIGDFKLVTFPGELTVQIGLNIKQASKDPAAFVAGYTNGYLHYTPTVEQRTNTGFAQEDCDTMVAPEWQKLFEKAALEVLSELTHPPTGTAR